MLDTASLFQRCATLAGYPCWQAADPRAGSALRLLSRLEASAQLREPEAADLDDQRRNEQLASGTVNVNLDELNQAGLVRLLNMLIREAAGATPPIMGWIQATRIREP